jgi:hypothetical protein
LALSSRPSLPNLLPAVLRALAGGLYPGGTSSSVDRNHAQHSIATLEAQLELGLAVLIT